MSSAPSFADDRVDAVAGRVQRAFAAALGERLRALVVHGGAVTGYIPGFSDFDFVLVMSDELTLKSAASIQAKLERDGIEPFSYLQISKVVRVDVPDERLEGLVDGAYRVIHGELPEAWAFHDDMTLRRRGDESILRARSEITRRTVDWAVATGARKSQLVRCLVTVLKPALRGRLVALGEPVQPVWRASYGDLARRWRTHSADAAEQFETWLRMLPPTPRTESEAGRLCFQLLTEVIADG